MFTYCPACGLKGITFTLDKLFRCPACGFEYFHNVASSAGVIIEAEGKILFTVRGMAPSAGLLGLPGGFINPQERAEDAALRECREEIGWEPPDLTFFATFPNSYLYQGIRYNTCDLYFTTRVNSLSTIHFTIDHSETKKISLIPVHEIDLDQLAFPSTKEVIKLYCQRRN